MSDAVTTPTLAQAAGVGDDGTSSDAGKPADLGAQMRLHLAKRGEERAKAAEGDEKVEGEEPEAGAAEGDEEAKPAEDDAEPADDAKPHWAKKLKGDLEAAQKKVGEYDQRMQHVAEGARAARDKIADLTVDAEHHKAYAAWLEQQIDLAGLELPAVWREKWAQQRELSALKAASQRGQASTNDAAVEKLRGELVARANAVIAKFPELDPKKNPDARAFWQTALAVSPDKSVPAPKLDDLEAQAEAWAAIRRGRKMLDAEAARKKAAPPPPPAAKPPAVAGQRGTAGKPTPQKQAPITASTMKDYLAKKRAARGA